MSGEIRRKQWGPGMTGADVIRAALHLGSATRTSVPVPGEWESAEDVEHYARRGTRESCMSARIRCRDG